MTVQHNQLWFWTKRWQAEEQKVQQDFLNGRVKVSKSIKDFLDDLDTAHHWPGIDSAFHEG